MSFSSAVLSYKILKELGTPFNEMNAFTLGLIDKDGKRLKKSETKEEKEAVNSFNLIIINLKRLLQKFVGKNKTVNKIVSLFLLKEGFNEVDSKLILESLDLVTDTENISDSKCMMLVEEFLVTR